MTSREQKAVDALISMADSVEYNPYVFAGALLNVKHPVLVGNIIKGMVAYLKLYRKSVGYHPEDDIVNLTDFDKPVYTDNT